MTGLLTTYHASCLIICHLVLSQVSWNIPTMSVVITLCNLVCNRDRLIGRESDTRGRQKLGKKTTEKIYLHKMPSIRFLYFTILPVLIVLNKCLLFFWARMTNSFHELCLLPLFNTEIIFSFPRFVSYALYSSASSLKIC